MTIEQQVAQHYTRDALEQTILDALKAAGKDPDRLSHVDLAPVDEFHIGGRQATIAFATVFAPQRGMHLLDVGCGLGGASRYFAHEHGCRVTGIDLTDGYVRAAAMLSRRVGLDEKVSYRQASALALPFPDATFDGAYMLHVGMNIADKVRLFSEVRRVLKPDANFGIYDVMRESDDAIVFPVPWATSAETSFVDTPQFYSRALIAAGFNILTQRSRRDFAVQYFREMRERMTNSPSPLGQQIVMGPTIREKLANLGALIDRGVIAPTEIIARAV
jgi:ubiquinone/menaquinone biosynthesis C-methylase UbiE